MSDHKQKNQGRENLNQTSEPNYYNDAVQRKTQSDVTPSSIYSTKKTPNSGSNSNETCKFYLEGRCSKGSACKYLHPSNASIKPNTQQRQSKSPLKPKTSTTNVSSHERGIVHACKEKFGFIKSFSSGSLIYFNMSHLDASVTKIREGDEVEFDQVLTHSNKAGQETCAQNIRLLGGLSFKSGYGSSLEASQYKSNEDIKNTDPSSNQDSHLASLSSSSLSSNATASTSTSSGSSFSNSSSTNSSGSSSPMVTLAPAWLTRKKSSITSSTFQTQPSPTTGASQTTQSSNSPLSSKSTFSDSTDMSKGSNKIEEDSVRHNGPSTSGSSLLSSSSRGSRKSIHSSDTSSTQYSTDDSSSHASRSSSRLSESPSPHTSSSGPAPRIRKKTYTSTSLHSSNDQSSSQIDLSLLGGSLSVIPIRGDKFHNKTAMMRWIQNFAQDPTSILLQRNDLEELLQQPYLPFVVIAELIRIFAHHEFRESGRTDRILQIVAESSLLRNPKNLRTYIIKLSNVLPPAPLVYQENLENAILFINDLMDRYPQYLGQLPLDIFAISSDKLFAAYPEKLAQDAKNSVQKGKDIMSEAGKRLLNNPTRSTHGLDDLAEEEERPPSPKLALDSFQWPILSTVTRDHNNNSSSGQEDSSESKITSPDSHEEKSAPSRENQSSASKSSNHPPVFEDFREMPLFPTIHEIMAENSQLASALSKNIVQGKYTSLMHYLDTHFRLLREDAITSIRDGIKAYKMTRKKEQTGKTIPSTSTQRGANLPWGQPSTPTPSLNDKSAPQTTPSDVTVYKNVRLTGICPSPVGIVYRISFTVGSANRQSQIDWKSSKKLLYGSLLCLSCDHFETLLWATVANRDLNLLSTGQEIDVKFSEGSSAFLDPNVHYTMVESNSTYYEAYQHVLSALKNINVHTFPFLDYLIYCKSEVDAPSYMKTKSVSGVNSKPSFSFNMSNVFDGNYSNFDIFSESWDPTSISTTMDSFQLDALKQALTKEIAVIQGPPGTGKTFVGLKVMRALLDNRDSFPSTNGPILVVCYTNHALDQFLEGIMAFEPNVIRIGSRSKSEILKDRNLRTLLYESNAETNEHFRARKMLTTKMKDLQEEIETRFVDLAKSNLTSEDLKNVVEDEDQVDSLFGTLIDTDDESKALEAWLCMKPTELLQLVGKKETKSTSKQESSVPVFKNFGASVIDTNSELEFPSLQSNQNSNSNQNQYSDTEVPDFEEEEDDEDFVEQAEGMDRIMGDSFASLSSTMRTIKDSSELKISELSASLSSILGDSGSTEPMNDLLKFRNVWKISSKRDKPILQVHGNKEQVLLSDRQILYLHWLSQFRTKFVQPLLSELCDDYQHLCNQKKVLDQDAQVQVLMSSAVIGMTTTGVAKFHNIVKAVGASIVVVEEAAEVLEAHIVTALTPATKHLILIGDHEQLRPTTAVYRLAVKYKLDVSLFERLISNGFQVKTLSRQRRMRPEISQFVQPIYPLLSNHPDVHRYPNVSGLGDNIFFIDHTVPEDNEGDFSQFSKTNKHEATFLARLCSYLLLQGYSNKQVTILTAYSGQVKMIRNELKNLGISNVHTTSVDNYQGQECDIIFLSLVRSNSKGTIGFLNTSNRICVAMSRAKIGLYIIGNSKMLAEKNPLWAKIIQIFQSQNVLSSQLRLQCQQHPEKVTLVQKEVDFKMVEDGGCDKRCLGTLGCGHPCQRFCHPYPHSQVLCHQPCKNVHQKCGHACTRRCFEDCGECQKLVMKQLDCGHEMMVECSEESPICTKKVQITLKCGHMLEVTCHEARMKSEAVDHKPTKSDQKPKKNLLVCLTIVTKTLSCGHNVEVACHLVESGAVIKCPMKSCA